MSSQNWIVFFDSCQLRRFLINAALHRKWICHSNDLPRIFGSCVYQTTHWPRTLSFLSVLFFIPFSHKFSGDERGLIAVESSISYRHGSFGSLVRTTRTSELTWSPVMIPTLESNTCMRQTENRFRFWQRLHSVPEILILKFCDNSQIFEVTFVLRKEDQRPSLRLQRISWSNWKVLTAQKDPLAGTRNKPLPSSGSKSLARYYSQNTKQFITVKRTKNCERSERVNSDCLLLSSKV